jgi:hypothetical protein
VERAPYLKGSVSFDGWGIGMTGSGIGIGSNMYGWRGCNVLFPQFILRDAHQLSG